MSTTGSISRQPPYTPCEPGATLFAADVNVMMSSPCVTHASSRPPAGCPRAPVPLRAPSLVSCCSLPLYCIKKFFWRRGLSTESTVLHYGQVSAQISWVYCKYCTVWSHISRFSYFEELVKPRLTNQCSCEYVLFSGANSSRGLIPSVPPPECTNNPRLRLREKL